MSEKLGQLSWERDHRPVHMGGGGFEAGDDYSPETAREIDSEVRRMLEEQHARVTAILGAKTEILGRAARALLERETLTGVELQAIAAGQLGTPREPAAVTGTRTVQETDPTHEVQASEATLAVIQMQRKP
jgi:cell division protease FtsH